MPDPFALHMPHWPKHAGHEPAGTPSERARQLLARLSHPETSLPPVVHVGGTKGKGSTIAFLRAMLEAAGYRVHVYTSPHLARFNERIVLAGRDIGDDALFSVLEETRAASTGMDVGFFDATTAAAMLAFARTPADILLMEMGLGGAVDATNIIDTPLLTILTTLSYDHTEYMGTTLPEIASFEAGLFKTGIPCVVSYQHDTVWPVLDHTAAALSAPLYGYGRQWRVAKREDALLYSDAHGSVALPLPGLPGAHQLVNAGGAIAALGLLHDFDVRPAHVEQGLKAVRWKGRLEKREAALLPPESELWFDGGHNSAAGEAIAYHASVHWQDRPFYLIFGTTRGKDIASIVRPFAGMTQRLYGVSVKSEPNSYAAAAIVSATSPLLPAESADSIHDALQDIIAREPRPFRALVFGSLYLWLEASQLR